MHYLIKLDKQFLKWAYECQFGPVLLIRFLVFIGDGPFWMMVVLFTATVGQLADSIIFTRLSAFIMAGFFINSIIVTTLKSVVKRRRPYADYQLHEELQIRIENRDPKNCSNELESFPSGHVLWTTMSVTIICSQCGYPTVFLLGWLIPAMIYLRLHQGVHYPSDVLASLVIGCLTLMITLHSSPLLIKMTTDIHRHAVYLWGYWIGIGIFLLVGFGSWWKNKKHVNRIYKPVVHD